METLVTFGLGAGTVLIIIGVVVVFKLVKQVKQIGESLSSTIDELYQNGQTLNRRIDQEADRVDGITNNIYSAIDSRLDKLEAKITNNKQVLKG